MQLDKQVPYFWLADPARPPVYSFVTTADGLFFSYLLPLTKPPFGRITAIDLSTGEVMWIAPHGAGPRDHVKLKSPNLPPQGWPSRGFVLVTKTLLFAVQEPAVSTRFSNTSNTFEFTATTREPRVRIFNKSAGNLVQEVTLPANAGGAPITYNVGPQQYVVVPVDGGGVAAELVALALHDGESEGKRR